MQISKVHARQILDSRGNPTVECDVILKNGIFGRAAVPSGASTGTNEAIELRDGDPRKYLGLGVLKAVENVNTIIAGAVSGKDSTDQEKIDQIMIELDGTENKGKFGANAMLSVSLACAKAAAQALQKPFFAYIAGTKEKTSYLLPVPMMNIINGGKHANFSTDIQEYMILPVGAGSFSEALRWGAEVFHHLGKVIKKKGYETTVGDEGGYAPQVKGGNSEPFELMAQAVENAGYSLGKDIVLGIDAAASEFFDPSSPGGGKYILKKERKTLSPEEMVDWISGLTKKYPIVSLEDCLDQSDWKGWQLLTAKIGKTKQIVGDDLLVTNIKFLDKGIQLKAANAILIKPNQIGTLTETMRAVEMAQKFGWNTVMSHRSGETEDSTIAHLAVGLSTGQIKAGSLSRSDRICKYNELLRIEELLGEKAIYAGKNPFKNL